MSKAWVFWGGYGAATVIALIAGLTFGSWMVAAVVAGALVFVLVYRRIDAES